MVTKLIGNLPVGLVFIVSAPAGTGKTTLVRMLMKQFPDSIVSSVSYTTRPCRAGEIPGVHYHFISEEEFEDKITKNEFLEHVKLYGHHYGTAYQSVRDLQNMGKHVILVIDTQGALQLKEKISAVFVFLQPPSLEVLLERLENRCTETKDAIDERLAWAARELEMACFYDYCIINDNLNIALQVLQSIVIAEEHRVPYSAKLVK